MDLYSPAVKECRLETLGKHFYWERVTYVVVDHDCLLAHILESQSGTDSTPIELYGTSDSVLS